MNYLAHLRLAPPGPLSLLGNLMGDFMRGVQLSELPQAVRAGVAQHRAVDAFTDQHPVFRSSRARVDESLRRFGGVLVDVFYDHFLARHWGEFGDGRELRAFVDECYEVLRSHTELLPERLAYAAPHMAREDWLGG